MPQPIRFSDAPDATPFPGVITKLLMNKEKGSAAITVGEVRIMPGHTLPLHIHKVEEALVFLSGDARVETGGKEVPVTGPSILLTPAGTKHSVTNVGTDEVRILFFFPAIEVERILVE